MLFEPLNQDRVGRHLVPDSSETTRGSKGQAPGTARFNSKFYLKPIVGQRDPRRECVLRGAMIEAVRKMGQEGAPGFNSSTSASASLNDR